MAPFVCQLASMPLWGFVMFALLVGVGAGVGAYYGVQSIRQGLLLKQVVPPHLLSSRVGQCVAITGRAERLDDHPDPLQAKTLWVRTRMQEYRRSYRSGSGSTGGGWRTVSTDERHFPFQLQLGDQVVQVRNKATEVHGAQKRVGYDSSPTLGGGLLGSFFGSNRTRTIVETLIGGREITCVGKLSASAADGSLSLIKDDAVGMLLTGYAGATQAYMELGKGVLGVLLPPLWLIGCVWIYQTHY